MKKKTAGYMVQISICMFSMVKADITKIREFRKFESREIKQNDFMVLNKLEKRERPRLKTCLVRVRVHTCPGRQRSHVKSVTDDSSPHTGQTVTCKRNLVSVARADCLRWQTKHARKYSLHTLISCRLGHDCAY